MKNSHESGPSNTKPFADVLNEQFRLTGKKAAELAKFLGCSPQVVSRWRSGTAVPQKNKWVAIAEFFGVHIRAFLSAPGPAKDYTAEEKSIHAENDMYGRFLKFKGNKEEFAQLESLTVKELDATFSRVKERFGITPLEVKINALKNEEKLALKKPATGERGALPKPKAVKKKGAA